MMKGKAIVIGASSGIGKALAETMAADGWMVGIMGKHSEILVNMWEKEPNRFVPMEIDLSESDATNRLGHLIAKMGGIELLVINPSRAIPNPQLDTDLEWAINVVNTCGFAEITLFGYKYFLTRKGGMIAAITSVAGLRGDGIAPSYCASKAYQINFLEGLRKRSAKQKNNITVTDLRMGSIKTETIKSERHFWISTPEEAARTMYRAILKKKAVQYVTPRWRWAAWLLRNMPTKLYNKL